MPRVEMTSSELSCEKGALCTPLHLFVYLRREACGSLVPAPLLTRLSVRNGFRPGARLLFLDVQDSVDGLLGLRQSLLSEAGELGGVEPTHLHSSADRGGGSTKQEGRGSGRLAQAWGGVQPRSLLHSTATVTGYP